MKKTFFLPALSLLIFGCFRSETNKNDKPSQFPKPGTIISTAEMPVTEDPLNHFTFSIKITADSNITAGVYDVEAAYGPNTAQGKFSMPKGGEYFKPLIRKGNGPYTYIIGFRAPGDTTFYDYFEVSSSRSATKMQYIKAYNYN
jgi:hypothetical protein